MNVPEPFRVEPTEAPDGPLPDYQTAEYVGYEDGATILKF